MASSDTLTCQGKNGLAEQVDRFEEKHDFESRNQAMQHLLRVGLREETSPILSRWRERVINWAGLLALFGIMFLAAGIVLPEFHPRWAILMSVVLISAALMMVGIVELARMIRGSSELGEAAREVLKPHVK